MKRRICALSSLVCVMPPIDGYHVVRQPFSLLVEVAFLGFLFFLNKLYFMKLICQDMLQLFHTSEYATIWIIDVLQTGLICIQNARQKQRLTCAGRKY